MSKLRHIALSVPDPWKAAAFYQRVFGMKKIGETDSILARGVYLTDGTVNMALLNYKTDEMAGHRGKDFVGIHHLGFWVDDNDEARQNIEAAGGKYWMGEVPRNSDNSNVFYEVKFHDPNGVVVDISANGWGGAVKEVTPAASKAAARKKAAPAKKLRAAAAKRRIASVKSAKRTKAKSRAKARR